MWTFDNCKACGRMVCREGERVGHEEPECDSWKRATSASVIDASHVATVRIVVRHVAAHHEPAHHEPPPCPHGHDKGEHRPPVLKGSHMRGCFCNCSYCYNPECSNL